MRNIKRIFIHCTATPQQTTIDTLQAGFRARGWDNPGYHYVIPTDGSIVQLQPEDRAANGVQGFNSTAIHIAYIGGVIRDEYTGQLTPSDTRTTQQRAAIRHLLQQLRTRYPHAQILGHRDIWGADKPRKWHKMCPCFNASREYADI